MADKIVVLNQGTVAQVGPPMDLYHRPDNEFVATFIGSPEMNVLPVTITRENTDRARIAGALGMSFTLADTSFAVGAARLGVRPEHIKVVDT